jgi:hypothetical protein
LANPAADEVRVLSDFVKIPSTKVLPSDEAAESPKLKDAASSPRVQPLRKKSKNAGKGIKIFDKPAAPSDDVSLLTLSLSFSYFISFYHLSQTIVASRWFANSWTWPPDASGSVMMPSAFKVTF